ncbi:uracil-DNA glycosylase [Chelatococcus sp. SYSU_G07232]|uniref:Type-4 uracil-DNA glycosylase n=1 Tax=Chelatococcus albus TaxID=3047466 RepID=A0ABT7AEM0_9HYPH|nr:uracil-DNA glycosylase [Chelatococcus sp. SYSU_G07232]MDJ1157820.1 uracil-DNA glycosylase [Chelatococcus sp. SYSU_G07232]
MSEPAVADPRAFEALLDFYVEAGVDLALDESPHDRFAESAALAASRREAAVQAREAGEAPGPADARQTLPAPARPAFAAAGNSADEAALAARARAREAKTLDELKEALAAFEGCALKTTAKNLVFADGNPEARLMFVGEAPGREEDLQGLPFVGRSGQLLDRMLAAIGLDRSAVYIANIVPWRPPGNRTPTPQEAAVCRPFIERQIELCDPDVLVCLGGPSAQALLGVRDGILKARGKWLTYETGRRTIRAIATLHPAYLLRQPLQKRLAWRDFRAIRRALNETPPSA